MPTTKHPRKPAKKTNTDKQLTQVWVMKSTADLIRRLAETRRQSMVIVTDDAVRAAFGSELITADEGQPGYAHHGE